MTWGANTKTASSQSERIIMHSSRIREMLQNCNPGLNTLRKGSTVWSPTAQMALPSWSFGRYFLFALIGSSLLYFYILFKLPNFQDVPFFTFPDTTVATTIFLAVGAKVERVNRTDQQFCITWMIKFTAAGSAAWDPSVPVVSPTPLCLPLPLSLQPHHRSPPVLHLLSWDF